ncbi:histidine--tRNA ligase [Sulfurimonas sp. MAG313]|nr:histidine--tRNA ligase [Sulfurimonas sp. MAG313]MDF1882131.1 histidine--tRNA ligase [Sulfurimonas sp. MAG313]
MIRSLRGMNDTLDIEDSQRFSYFIQTATRIAKNYGFRFIETPQLEETALFKRSVGESSDIVGKEMYQFTDKGKNDVCLRPEGTAGVVRAFVQNKYDRQDTVQRLFYHGTMFRYERPQKGRLRQFHQFGCESFGESNILEDASLILMVRDIFSALGINFTLKLNSLGDQNCMPAYRDSLVSFLQKHQEEICEDCQRRKSTNPIRVLDCKNSHCQDIYANAPKLMQNLCEECDTDFKALSSILDEHGMAYEIDTHLVRGLDYYSKTAFEFISTEIGAQSAIAGGGRYDRLVEFLDGRATPAIGFAIGIERLMELIQMPEISREGYYFGAMDENSIHTIYAIGMKKRVSDKVTIGYKARNLKAHLKASDKANAQYCVILGENELNNGTLWVKDLLNKTEFEIPQKEF